MVFGPKKLPELGRGLGDGIRSFKDSVKEKQESLATVDDATRVDLPGKNEASSVHVS